MNDDPLVPVPWVWDETVGSVLATTALRYPDQDAVVFPQLKLRWSWRELNGRVDQIAAALIALGVQAGQAQYRDVLGQCRALAERVVAQPGQRPSGS